MEGWKGSDLQFALDLRYLLAYRLVLHIYLPTYRVWRFAFARLLLLLLALLSGLMGTDALLALLFVACCCLFAASGAAYMVLCRSAFVSLIYGAAGAVEEDVDLID